MRNIIALKMTLSNGYSKSVMNICIVFLNAQIESISNGMVKCKNTA